MKEIYALRREPIDIRGDEWCVGRLRTRVAHVSVQFPNHSATTTYDTISYNEIKFI